MPTTIIPATVEVGASTASSSFFTGFSVPPASVANLNTAISDAIMVAAGASASAAAALASSATAATAATEAVATSAAAIAAIEAQATASTASLTAAAASAVSSVNASVSTAAASASSAAASAASAASSATTAITAFLGAPQTYTATTTFSGAGAGLVVTNNATIGGVATIQGNTVTVGGGGASTVDFAHAGTGNWRFTLGGASSIYNFRALGGGSVLRVTPTSAPVNYINVTSGNTGSNASLVAAGSDTDVSLTLSAQGAGNINVTSPIQAKFFHAAPGSIVWSGSASDGVTINPYRMTGISHTGSSSAPAEARLNVLNVSGSDAINMTAGGKVVGWKMVHNVGAGANGTRNGLHYELLTTGVTSNVDFLTAANFFSTAAHNMGGSSNTAAGSAGNVFGLNSYAVATSGATFTQSVMSYEANVSVRDPAGSFRKVGIQVVADSADNGPGKTQDAAFSATNQLGARGFRDAYTIGISNGQFPLASTGETSVIRVYTGQNYFTFGTRAYWGVNLREADIAGWAFASPGFSVDGSGSVQVGTGLLQATATGVKLSAPGSVGASATVAAGGSNYTVGDVIYDSDGAGGTYGGVYRVLTVSGTSVLTVSMLKAPFVPGAAPSNPRSTTTWQITTQGTGCTLNITWTAGSEVVLGTSGGKHGFYGGTSVTKPTVTGSKASGAALTSLLAALVSLNLITDTTSA